ncbi:hypothetical protein [endosymbiont GvMRE of Glomus versiforme]|uniref:hypothetical protein n=1 Tax=endosymbiont GvMRE of Glomus versiforme TaxID=2039283 RepID=UPI000ED0EFCC|nr:hypothetical protein [endosymbiont GvMRE of Glomus versiforme]RHZ35428.1 hypothetical protein GvMRE_IIg10 [endosymbiont GvMRE of Glomus versiforme]
MTDLTNILLWKTTKIENAFYLQIAKQKFLGLPRSDKHGITYWKFREIRDQKVSNQSNNNSPASPAMDNLEKFNQRQSLAEALRNEAEVQRPEKAEPRQTN